MSSGDISYVFGDSFDPSSVTPAEAFDPIPPGKYAVLIEEAEIKTTKGGDGKYVKLKLRVVEGAHAKRFVFDNINIQNPSQQCVEIGVRTLAALGQAIGLQRISDTSQLVNKVVLASVKVDGEYNKVKTYSPVQKLAPDGFQQNDQSPHAKPTPPPALLQYPASKPAASQPAAKPPWMK